MDIYDTKENNSANISHIHEEDSFKGDARKNNLNSIYHFADDS